MRSESKKIKSGSLKNTNKIMQRVCIFCGNPPEKKNKEHIIPKWLMKLTSTESKKMSVGVDWASGREIVFDFKSFTFPSCTECNTNFSKIESQVKPIIEGILQDRYTSSDELIILLDWFDKIRVSLWLGIQYHNSEYFNLTPKYYINNRVRLKDRMLAITNCYDDYKGLRWTGANTLCFISSPTCITLKINNVLFTNCSMDFILSEQLGFPYIRHEFKNQINPELQNIILNEGTKKLKRKLFRSNLYSPTFIVSQPIYKVGLGSFRKLYENDFVYENSYDFEKGEGKLFITHNLMTYPMEFDEEISFGRENKERKNFKLNKPTLEFQIELLTSRNLIFANTEDKETHNSSLKYIVNHTIEQIKQYNY